MDLQMPEMDGFEASQRILKMTKEAGEEDYCHIVALTAYTVDDWKSRASELGLKDTMYKPLHHKDLERMVYLHFYRISMNSFKERFPHL